MAKTIPEFKVTDPADYELSFQSDAVMPAQFFHERQGSGALKPFSLLMHAILIDAVRCYQVNFDARRPSKKQQFSEARGWLFHDEDNGPFSFRKVCDALEIDPHHVRRGLISWKIKRLAGEKVATIRRSPVPFASRISQPRRASHATTSPVKSGEKRNGQERIFGDSETVFGFPSGGRGGGASEPSHSQRRRFELSEPEGAQSIEQD